MTEAGARVTFRDVFGVAEFRALWLAELFSVLGDQLARVALSVIVFRDTGSAALTGLTYALTYAPSLLGGIFLSGLADRHPRREVMATVDFLRAGLILLVAVPALPFWALCLLVGSVSLVNPLFKSAQLAVLPDVLPGDAYVVGMSIRTITIQAAQLAGFAGGGLAMLAVDPRLAIVLDAATFLVSALFIRTGLRARPAARARETVQGGWLRTVGTGGRLVLADRGVRVLFGLIWLMAAITAYEGLAAPYAAAIGGGSAAVGLLLASDPLGSVIGLFVFGRWVPARVRPRLIGPAAVLAAAVLVPCLLWPGLLTSMVLLIVSGGLGSIVVMQATASFTLAVPDAHRAQVLGLSNTGLTTATGLAPLAAGLLADRVGAPPAVGWFGLAGLLLAIPAAVIWWRVRHADPRRWNSSE